MKTEKRKKHNELIIDYVKFHVAKGGVTSEWICKMLDAIKP